MTDRPPETPRAPRTFSPDPDASQDTTEFDPAADRALVLGFLARDPLATEELMRRLRCVPRILGGLNRRMGNPLNADDLADLAQDTAVIVLRKLDGYLARSPMEAWIYRVCSLELRNAVRRRRRLRTVDLLDVVPANGSSMTEAVERREYVLHALERVRSLDATAVRLHQLEGLTFVEIAERLQMSVNAVKGRYYRGIEQLNELLKSRPAEGDA